MATSESQSERKSDFDVAKAIEDHLRGKEKERQLRILRWVAESLDLEPRRNEPHTPTEDHETPRRDESHRTERGSTDIKTFVDSKKPKSDVQFAAVIAYFYRFEAAAENKKETIDAETLQNAARLAGRRRPPSARATLNNAKSLGYLDGAERGQFRINSVGENLVAMTLPGGSEPERARRKPTSRKARKAKKR